ncbi:MAG: type I methionyl aminopeptidase [Actinomycetia bacterium]|nr:type I methionyl aminopeptidase [Actinomycetes bacterium]
MVELKSPAERERMREAGRVVAEVLQILAAAVRPGLPTLELDRLAEREIRRRGARPVFKGYQARPGQPGYPASVCVSVNDEVVHGIPGPRRLREGDLVSLDLGAEVGGLMGDAALSVFVGAPPDAEAERLWRVTREALDAGIRAVRVGGHIGDIGAAVQRVVEGAGFSVVREFVGHGIGRALHEDPQVPNYGLPGRGPRIRPGMALAIEPMVNAGDWPVEVLEDGWTAVTRDGSLSCHFEHTVFVGEDGVEVLTALPES